MRIYITFKRNDEGVIEPYEVVGDSELTYVGAECRTAAVEVDADKVLALFDEKNIPVVNLS